MPNKGLPMRNFTICQVQPKSEESPVGDLAVDWYVEVDGFRQRHYSSQWTAIIAAFVAAHDATLEGDEATIVIETACNQVWNFSLMPGPEPGDPLPIDASIVGRAAE